MSNIKYKKLITVALFVAIFFVLSIICTIDTGAIKLTLQNIPLYLGAIFFGPIYGALIGFLGMFLNQLLRYGIEPMTIIWMLPHTIIGFLAGLIFKTEYFKNIKGLKTIVAVILLNLLLSILNTFALMIDSKMKGYFSFYLIFGSFLLRLMIAVLSGIVYGTIIPFIYNAIKKYIDLTN